MAGVGSWKPVPQLIGAMSDFWSLSRGLVWDLPTDKLSLQVMKPRRPVGPSHDWETI